ncbi:MAG: substrate-binding domain-containing protein [Anaerolineae bacterium]
MTHDLDRTPIYQQIAEVIRLDIVNGVLHSGDALPSMRAMAERWQCTVGTVQRAYAELAREGLTITRFGQGTHVAQNLLQAAPERSLRRSTLANQSERFLLDMLAAGFQSGEVERAVRQAVERWQASTATPAPADAGVVRFAGSHDVAVSWLAAHFETLVPGWALAVRFNGSLGGLMALAQGEAELAGCHLWDPASDSTNSTFVRHLLPGQPVALLTLAHRRLGLITPPGNPQQLTTLADLLRADVQFINRQRGSGTRVWLDAQLQACRFDPASIAGYAHEAATHTQVAQAVAAGEASAGLGIEAAALALGLGFTPLTSERYDLVVRGAQWEHPAVQALRSWLTSPDAQAVIATFGGYDNTATGRVIWVA